MNWRKMALQVKSKKPAIFQLETGGEFYMIGSEVGHYLNYMKGALYKKYPSLWRRIPSVEERRKLLSLDIGYNTMSNSNIMIVKASEVEEILRGLGEQFKERQASVENSPRPKSTSGRAVSGAGVFQLSSQLTRETIHASVRHLNAVSYQSRLSGRNSTRGADLKRQTLRRKVLPSLRWAVQFFLRLLVCFVNIYTPNCLETKLV